MGTLAKKTPSPAPDRLKQTIAWIIDGHSEADIRESIAKLWPDQTAEPLIVASLKKIGEYGEPDPLIVRGFAIEGTRTIYQKALAIGDLPTALRALKQLTQLTA